VAEVPATDRSQVAQATDAALALDNCAIQRHCEFQTWLKMQPRFVVHFTPIGASWPNIVEIFFRDISITDKRVWRDSFASVD